jgi:hypothetical protein
VDYLRVLEGIYKHIHSDIDGYLHRELIRHELDCRKYDANVQQFLEELSTIGLHHLNATALILLLEHRAL